MKGNELLPADNEKATAFNNILRFMTDADIVLSAKEEVILDRWIYCDTMLRSRKWLDDDIIDKVVAKFSVSKFTARNDIYQAQSLFGSCRKYSKRYLLYNHAQDIAMQIERIKYDKSLAHLLPKLNDSYTKALNALPDEIKKSTLPPPVFKFMVVKGQHLPAGMDYDAAMAMADQLIAEDEQREQEYADFEDVPENHQNDE